MRITKAKLALSREQENWLTAAFDRNRARFGDLRMELEEGTEGEGKTGEGEGSGEGEKPFAELSADEKVEFLLAKTRRLEDQTKGKSANPDARVLSKRIKELEAQSAKDRELRESLEAASKTEAERAADKAAAEAREAGAKTAASEALTKFGPRLVAAAFSVELAGRMSVDEVKGLVADLNIANFLGDDGEPDSDAVKAFVARIPAAKLEEKKLGPADLGAGKRSSSATTSGADLYAQRHPKPATT